MNHRQLPSTGVLLVLVTAVMVAGFGSIGIGEAFLSSSSSPHPPSSRAKTTESSFTTTEIFSSPQQQQSSSNSNDSDADLLKDLPFVPAEVMAKFMAAVGDPLTAGSIQAGYQAGVVSKDELEQIRTKFPNMQEAASATEIPQAQSPETIEAHWKAALLGQPWHVQTMGKLATATIVPLVAKLQEKSVQQANAMKWINENALPVIQGYATVVELLSSSSDSDQLLTFNNTRAKYETNRGVWSASMDVVVAGDGARTGKAGDDESSGGVELSEAGAALAALTEGIGDDDGYDDDLSSFVGSIDVLDSSTGAVAGMSQPPLSSSYSNNNNKVGLVNAYFVPDDEIKILVVEIDGILHNVTWKGLS